MYHRFTDRARKVMQLANEGAQQFSHEYIGTEHILLGLIREGSGVAANVLRNLGVDVGRIRLEVEKLVQRGPGMHTLTKLPQMPRAKKVIEYTMDESRNLKHDWFGTEHILLGLLREEDGVAACVLANLGLDVERVRAEILSVLARPYDWGRKAYSPLPPAQPIAERVQSAVEPPSLCPRCGQARVVRVLWRCTFLCGKNKEDVNAGRAILGSQSCEQGPPWVCLQCEPQWSEVHSLAQQDHEWQHAKEEAIDSQDFDTAAKLRDAQVELRNRLDSSIDELLRNR